MSPQPPAAAPTLGPGGLPIPVGPSLDAWRKMSRAQREAFLGAVLDALTTPADAITEGRPHRDALARAADRLGLHFRTLGRALYLAEEMAVVYPEEPAFSPDLLAVADVAQPERDERLAWVVADEGRGPDFVLEVLHLGDRKKDLVDNVQRYARLSIPEYFIYDRAHQQVIGYRLAAATRYERIVPQGGRVSSGVLGVDFAVVDGQLCLFQGAAELYGTSDLVARLSGMLGSVEARVEQAEAEARQAEARAEDERARADAATARAEEAQARARAGNEQLRGALLAALEARGITLTEAQRTRVSASEDVGELTRWLVGALRSEAPSIEALLDGEAAK